jgi:hypothetical protein
MTSIKKETAKKIAAGEWEFKGFEISKDEFENNLWWVKKIGKDSSGADFKTLKDAKEWIEQNA